MTNEKFIDILNEVCLGSSLKFVQGKGDTILVYDDRELEDYLFEDEDNTYGKF